MSTEPKPEVGMGASLLYPQDMYPLVIVQVTDHTIVVESLRPVSMETGHQPADPQSGYPLWMHRYTDQEIRDLRYPDGKHRRTRCFRRKDGRWYRKGSPILVGSAWYRRDHSL